MKSPAPLSALALLLGCSAAATPDCNRHVMCLMNYEPICGSDGRTYANQCVFDNAVCIAIKHKMPPLTQLFKGPCDMDPNPFCKQICPTIYKPVCGTDGKTYSNSCTLQAAKCKTLLLEVAYGGKCKPAEPACYGVCKEIYAPLCGSDGVTYDNQCQLDYAACQNPSLKLTKAYDGECNCAKPCPRNYAPVCGSDGKTYSNKCELTNGVCTNKKLTLAHNGACKA